MFNELCDCFSEYGRSLAHVKMKAHERLEMFGDMENLYGTRRKVWVVVPKVTRRMTKIWRHKVDIKEMKSLRNLCGVNRAYDVRSEEISSRVSVRK